jgi:16S rRNA (cytosine1402-N4)-methyltransferase
MAMFIEMIVHKPVMLKEVSDLLGPFSGKFVFADSTLGEGGYAEALLSRFPQMNYVGIEIDPAIIGVAKERLSGFGKRISFFNMWFSDFYDHYARNFDEAPDAILFDLGISRFHYEAGSRGFSFSRDEELDMRLDKTERISARTIVNESSENELARIFFEFGEERWGRRIASAIVRERSKQAITSSTELAKIVEGAIPGKFRHSQGIHPATRVFQALRIAVNHELENLASGIAAAFRVLKPGGKIGVISYHSLEDRIVKRFYNEKKTGCTCPPDWPICKCGGKPELRILTKKPVIPTEEEQSENRASRSAKLRVAEKLIQGGAAA